MNPFFAQANGLCRRQDRCLTSHLQTPPLDARLRGHDVAVMFSSFPRKRESRCSGEGKFRDGF
jgi:hypothetical protein